jgi:hypothetical protein
MDRRHLSVPEYAADAILAYLYSVVTIQQPFMSLDLIRSRFVKDGGSLSEYEAAIRFALENDWLLLSADGTQVEFGKAGVALCS